MMSRISSLVQLEVLLERVARPAGGAPGCRRDARGAVAQGRVECQGGRLALEADVVQQALGSHRDERLEALRGACLAHGARAVLALPDVPPGARGLADLVALDLDRDAHRQRVVAQRVKPDQHAGVKVDCEQHGHVDAGDIASDRMLLGVPAGFVAVADLQARLVGRAVAREDRGRAKRVGEHAEALVAGALDAEEHRRAGVRAGEQRPAARALDGVQQERVHVGLAGGPVDLGVGAAREGVVSAARTHRWTTTVSRSPSRRGRDHRARWRGATAREGAGARREGSGGCDGRERVAAARGVIGAQQRVVDAGCDGLGEVRRHGVADLAVLRDARPAESATRQGTSAARPPLGR